MMQPASDVVSPLIRNALVSATAACSSTSVATPFLVPSVEQLAPPLNGKQCEKRKHDRRIDLSIHYPSHQPGAHGWFPYVLCCMRLTIGAYVTPGKNRPRCYLLLCHRCVIEHPSSVAETQLARSYNGLSPKSSGHVACNIGLVLEESEHDTQDANTQQGQQHQQNTRNPLCQLDRSITGFSELYPRTCR